MSYLRAELGRYRAEDDSVLIPFYDHPYMERIKRKHNHFDHGSEKRTFIYGEKRCKESVSRSGHEDGNQNYPNFVSFCPWYLELTVYVTRYPVYMATAKCACPYCYDNTGKQYQDETMAPLCLPVNTAVKVLRQAHCKNGIRTYRRTYEYIAVGCMCTLPHFTKNSTQPLTAVVSAFNSHRHCVDPEMLPDFTWQNYSQLLERQTGTMLFGSDNVLGDYRSNITREEIFVEGGETAAICKPRFVYNIDTFRKPQRLMEQACANEMVFRDGTFYICRPISMYVSVLRWKTCHGGVRIFEHFWEPLHVGCAAYYATENLVEQRQSPVVSHE